MRARASCSEHTEYDCMPTFVRQYIARCSRESSGRDSAIILQHVLQQPKVIESNIASSAFISTYLLNVHKIQMICCYG